MRVGNLAHGLKVIKKYHYSHYQIIMMSRKFRKEEEILNHMINL